MTRGPDPPGNCSVRGADKKHLYATVRLQRPPAPLSQRLLK